MKPILYEATETDFTSLGLGTLADCISCEVDEELNGQYTLLMRYLVGGLHADDLAVGRLVLAKPNETDQTQPFEIYEVKEIDAKTIEVRANHWSYRLKGVPVAPFNATGCVTALTGLVDNSMVINPFTVWTDITNAESQFSVTIPQSFRACLGGVEGSILDVFGGEFKFDRSVVRLYAHRGADNGVTIRYGKNLESYQLEKDGEDAYSGCLAYWKNDDTSVSGDIQYAENHTAFAVEKIFLLDCSEDFEDPPTQADLNSKASAYVSNNSLGELYSDSVEISFIQLWQTEEYKNIASLVRVSLGDTVHAFVRSGSVSLRSIGYRYDSLNERYIAMVLGAKKASFADTIRQIAEESSAGIVEQATSLMQGAIDHAANVLAGGTGGYVVIGRNANGEPNEIYIMDTADMGTAVNVMRMNYAGIAFSNSGVNGPWQTAWLLDSTFYADYITAGEFNGNLVRAGSILTSALEVAVQTVVQGIKMNFSFLNDGLHIAQKDEQGNIVAAYQTLVSNLGLRVMDQSNNASLIAEGDSVIANNLTADQYLRLSMTNVASRFQEYYSSVHDEVQGALFMEV